MGWFFPCTTLAQLRDKDIANCYCYSIPLFVNNIILLLRCHYTYERSQVTNKNNRSITRETLPPTYNQLWQRYVMYDKNFEPSFRQTYSAKRKENELDGSVLKALSWTTTNRAHKRKYLSIHWGIIMKISFNQKMRGCLNVEVVSLIFLSPPSQ